MPVQDRVGIMVLCLLASVVSSQNVPAGSHRYRVTVAKVSMGAMMSGQDIKLFNPYNSAQPTTTYPYSNLLAWRIGAVATDIALFLSSPSGGLSTTTLGAVSAADAQNIIGEIDAQSKKKHDE
eukprot:SAG11_NODE_18505_length_489_cov_0.784615_1_plen_122_part_01